MKSISVKEAGQRGGLIGGKSKSQAKIEAVKKNLIKAHKALKLKRQMAKKLSTK